MEPGPPKLFWLPGVPVSGVSFPESVSRSPGLRSYGVPVSGVIQHDRHFVGLSFTEAGPPELFWLPGVPVFGVIGSRSPGLRSYVGLRVCPGTQKAPEGAFCLDLNVYARIKITNYLVSVDVFVRCSEVLSWVWCVACTNTRFSVSFVSVVDF